jgi:acyl-CoA thioesterase-1
MRWVIYFFGSGIAFFAGVALVLIALGVLSIAPRRWLTIFSTIAALLGLILVALSATPLPYWLYVLVVVVTLAWLTSERSRHGDEQRWRLRLRPAVLLVWLSCLALELPYHFVPSLSPAGQRRLYIFADSVTAGMGENGSETWPQLLARAESLDVQDCSQPGATVRTMLRRAQEMTLSDGIVLVEIGGNDLLGSTAAADYESQLDALLATLGGAGRLVVMMELPLPPFANEYGRAQRRLANKHGVRLIPKRIFVNVLTTDGATVDSIHLSPAGHELMAATVWELIRKGYDAP